MISQSCIYTFMEIKPLAPGRYGDEEIDGFVCPGTEV